MGVSELLSSGGMSYSAEAFHLPGRCVLLHGLCRKGHQSDDNPNVVWPLLKVGMTYMKVVYFSVNILDPK